MPEKFRKLMEFIHDELFYASDHLVSISESECLALGLTTPDVQQVLHKMVELRIVDPERHMIDFRGHKKPITHEDKVFIMTEPTTNLTGGSVAVKETEWFLIIPVLPKFDEFYNDSKEQKRKDELSYDSLNGILAQGGVPYKIMSKTRKALMTCLWERRATPKRKGEVWPKESVATNIGLIDSPHDFTTAIKAKLKGEITQLNQTFREKKFDCSIKSHKGSIQLVVSK